MKYSAMHSIPLIRNSFKGRSIGHTSAMVAVALLAFSGPCTAETSAAAGNNKFGYFPERPQVEFLDDGRKMELLRSFSYIDQNKKEWKSPSMSVVDGASIPRVLWSLVGGPFEGQYRNASIVHDTECDLRAHEWRDVHRMFYNATRAGGVGWVKGMLMYAAVYKFGPRWKLPPPPTVSATDSRDYLVRLLVILRRNVFTQSIKFDEIENQTYADVVKAVPDSDKDLGLVRQLLNRRNAIEAELSVGEPVSPFLKKLDDEIFLEGQSTPLT